MNPTEKLAALDTFVDDIERLHIESLKAGSMEDLQAKDIEIANAARRFCGMIKSGRTPKLKVMNY